MGSFTKDSEKYKGFTVYKTATQYAGCCKLTTVEPGEIYTVSAYLKADSDRLAISVYSNNSPNGAECSKGVIPVGLSSTEWKRLYATFIVTKGGDIRFRFEKESGGKEAIYICGYKLERGENRNPIWTPALEEMIFTKSELEAYLDDYMKRQGG